METLNITLKNFKYSASLSEETEAFTAVVCINGEPAFEASNHGTGGCNDYNPLKGQPIEKFREVFGRFEDYVTAITPEADKYKGWHASTEMDCLIGDQVTRELRTKDYQRMTRTKLVLVKGDELYTLNLKNKVRPDQLTAEQRAGIQSRNADCVILNFLPGTEGLDRYLAMGDK